MPQDHQKYLEWNGDRFRRWADSIGINTSKFVDGILTSGRVEQQSYRSCMGLLRLAEKHSQAKLEQPDASIAAIDYQFGRKLNKTLSNRLATCEYITEYRNIFNTGSTGSGKTYMACAFGMEACKHYYSVEYVRLPDLLLDLQAARDNGAFDATLKKYTKPVLLIIGEWLLLKLTEAEPRNLFELIHKRRKKSSTIFCSHFHESEW